jgi:hypothetical protein
MMPADNEPIRSGENKMKKHFFATVSAVALGMVCTAALGFTETVVPTEGPGLKPGWPGWYIAGSASDPAGPITLPPSGAGGNPNPAARAAAAAAAAAAGMPPRCAHSGVCEMDGTRGGGVSDTENAHRVSWKHTPGKYYTFAYPFDLPAGGGDVTGVGVDPQDNVWVWQRNKPGDPALFKFSADHKLLFSVPPDLTNHSLPFRGHGMGVDGEGNAWVINESGATVEKFSPDGKLLQTIGTKGHRGDWDEAKGQRLLWEPVTIDFGPQGDVYIFESHGDESPNDVGSDDPTDNIGVARVIHLDHDGKFINQWYGDQHGPGKFNSAHGSAVDPVTGDVWVGDRQDYRIVIFNANGKFIRTIAMRNLICALHFDTHKGPNFGKLWLATGMDGQVVQIDRNGNVLFVAGGTRRGIDPGMFSEATNMSTDSKGDLIVADTQIPRATELIPPTAAKAKK